MTENAQRLFNKYLDWLKGRTVFQQVGDWVEITTPYLDRHNDHLQIYVKKDNDQYILTDDSYIIEDLISSGCNLDTPKRLSLLKMTLSGFGVQQQGNQLCVTATEDNFGARKHSLLQAMLAVNDLFYLAEPVTAGLFIEDVMAWMDTVGIIYVANIKMSGESGYDHHFNFVMPKTKSKPERILEVVTRPNKDSAEQIMFKWHDTHKARSSEVQAYAMLNDTERPPSDSISNALRVYGIKPILWSDRDSAIGELVSTNGALSTNGIH